MSPRIHISSIQEVLLQLPLEEGPCGLNNILQITAAMNKSLW